MEENKKYYEKSSIDPNTREEIKRFTDIDVYGRLMDVRADYVFKRIFTADEKTSLLALMDFINSVLEFEDSRKIVELAVVNPQIPVDRAVQKKSIFDIRAK